MAKARLVHRCTECGATHPKWSGQCVTCGAWNCLVEDVEVGSVPLDTTSLAAGMALFPAGVATPIADVDPHISTPRFTGISELDRVLGGGFVPGSVTLLGGEPGIGKSTLLLQMLAGWIGRTLYVSAEESAQQVRLRAERLDAVRPDLWLLAESSLPNILRTIDELQPEVVVIDSIQTVADPELGSAPGSVVQVRGCAHRLVQEAKHRNVTMVLVGHVTKEGGLAGPRVLEHVVDTVLSFEGERHHALRLLRATKHRFGPTNELGLFEMVEAGLIPVPDASQLFLADRRTGVPGSVVVPTLDGRRPLLVEVQALLFRSHMHDSRAVVQGLDGKRVSMLLALLGRWTRLDTSDHEVYASVVGGLKLTEPGSDLAVCLAVSSAMSRHAVAADLVALGEVGLAGEIRQVSQIQHRLSEAVRLGFRTAIVPASAPPVDAALKLIRVSSLPEAVHAAGLEMHHGGMP